MLTQPAAPGLLDAESSASQDGAALVISDDKRGR